MEEYGKKHDHAISEKETDIQKLTELLLKGKRQIKQCIEK